MRKGLSKKLHRGGSDSKWDILKSHEVKSEFCSQLDQWSIDVSGLDTTHICEAIEKADRWTRKMLQAMQYSLRSYRVKPQEEWINHHNRNLGLRAVEIDCYIHLQQLLTTLDHSSAAQGLAGVIHTLQQWQQKGFGSTPDWSILNDDRILLWMRIRCQEGYSSKTGKYPKDRPAVLFQQLRLKITDAKSIQIIKSACLEIAGDLLREIKHLLGCQFDWVDIMISRINEIPIAIECFGFVSHVLNKLGYAEESSAIRSFISVMQTNIASMQIIDSNNQFLQQDIKRPFAQTKDTMYDLSRFLTTNPSQPHVLLVGEDHSMRPEGLMQRLQQKPYGFKRIDEFDLDNAVMRLLHILIKLHESVLRGKPQWCSNLKF